MALEIKCLIFKHFKWCARPAYFATLHSLRSFGFASPRYFRLAFACSQTGYCRFVSTPIIPTKKLATRTSFFIGALGRNRTGTPLLATDFKSAASTSSATSAYLQFKRVIHIKNYICNIKLVFFIKLCNINFVFFEKILVFLIKTRQKQRFGVRLRRI